MHVEPLNINVQEVVESGPLAPKQRLQWSMVLLALFGATVFCVALCTSYPKDLLWGSFYVNLLFWMGLSVGGVMTTVIFQIVRAKWSPPIRRIAEANIAFLPWAFCLLLVTYFGRKELFPWGDAPMPGREWWMESCFVYIRFALLFGLFFFLLYRYVFLSLRGDIGMMREQDRDNKHWRGWIYKWLSREWKGTEQEVPTLQRRMSWNAPVLVLCYVTVYTLFATEMIGGMDTIWFSNMFGGFQFLGNIYMGWAMTYIWVIYLSKNYPQYNKTIQSRQLWDLGMLTFGFCMLWGYTFFAQFLPQWYANMPEETQWLILRTREYPWKAISWMTFSFCFVLPFILLLSEDVKKNPRTGVCVCLIVLLGVWLEKYVLVMPQLSPDAVPLGFIDISLFLGFLGLYVLCVQGFLKKYPYIPVSHPLTKGSLDW